MSHVFARCASQNTHGHARIARETLACPCVCELGPGVRPAEVDGPGLGTSVTVQVPSRRRTAGPRRPGSSRPGARVSVHVVRTRTVTAASAGPRAGEDTGGDTVAACRLPVTGSDAAARLSNGGPGPGGPKPGTGLLGALAPPASVVFLSFSHRNAIGS